MEENKSIFHICLTGASEYSLWPLFIGLFWTVVGPSLYPWLFKPEVRLFQSAFHPAHKWTLTQCSIHYMIFFSASFVCTTKPHLLHTSLFAHPRHRETPVISSLYFNGLRIHVVGKKRAFRLSSVTNFSNAVLKSDMIRCANWASTARELHK